MDKRYVYYKKINVNELQYGVSRPSSWWNKIPIRLEGLDKIKKSIQQEGLRNPLIVNEANNKYIVEIGNQRLQALNDLNIKDADCVLYTDTEDKNLKEIKTLEDLNIHFKDPTPCWDYPEPSNRKFWGSY